MPQISADNPLYFLTSVTHKRLPVFSKEPLKNILAAALGEAQKSGNFNIFGYVIMPEHYHVVTDGERKPSEVLRFLNGISARRVINYLKENSFTTSLDKLRKADEGRKEYKYSLWEHHSNTFLITSVSKLLEKVDYIHQNPVKEGFVAEAHEYRFSSVRYWQQRTLLPDEPIELDLKELKWKS